VRYRSEQFAGVVLLRIREKFTDGCAFNDAALVHHGHGISEISNHTHVVGNDDDGGSIFITQISQQLQDFCLHGDIQSRGWFIGHDGFRTQF